MKDENVGKLDKVFRIVLAFVLSTLYITAVLKGFVGVLALIVGGYLIVTGVVGKCILYKLLNKSSVNTK